MFPIKDTVQSRSVPLATWAIILLNGLVFMYELSLPPDHLERLFRMLGMVPARLGTDPEAYSTLLTCRPRRSRSTWRRRCTTSTTGGC